MYGKESSHGRLGIACSLESYMRSDSVNWGSGSDDLTGNNGGGRGHLGQLVLNYVEILKWDSIR
jgi:hypothetical protein